MFKILPYDAISVVFRNSLLLQSECVVISWYIELELSRVIVDIKTLRRRKPNFYTSIANSIECPSY